MAPLINLVGREERYFDKFKISPDNQLLVFLGKDGYMPLVSNKVRGHICTVLYNILLYTCACWFDVSGDDTFTDKAVGWRLKDEWNSTRCVIHSGWTPLTLNWK